MWKMNAGMGDVVFTPLYEVLRAARGERALLPARAPPGAVGRRHLVRQDRSCSPRRDLAAHGIAGTTRSSPRSTTGRAGRARRTGTSSSGGAGRNRRCSPRRRRSRTRTGTPAEPDDALERGRHGLRPRRARHLGGVGPAPSAGRSTTRNSASEDAGQLLLGRDAGVPAVVQALRSRTWAGARRGPDLGAYVEPLDTYSDMSHLIPREDWQDVRQQHRLLLRPDAGQPMARTTTTARAAAKALRIELVTLPAVLPEGLPGGAFDWEPRRRRQTARARSASTRSTGARTPSAASATCRRPPARSRTNSAPATSRASRTCSSRATGRKTEVDGGCVEAAVISGQDAAQAIIGLPVPFHNNALSLRP